MAVFKATGCVAGCQPGTLASSVFPFSSPQDPAPSASIRCLTCLTYYEIRPDGTITSILGVVQRPVPPEMLRKAVDVRTPPS